MMTPLLAQAPQPHFSWFACITCISQGSRVCILCVSRASVDTLYLQVWHHHPLLPLYASVGRPQVMGWRDKREAIKEVSESAATYDREAAKEFLNVPKLYHLEIGVDSPAIVNAIVECPKGSSNKYKFCKEVGQLKLDRVFHSSAFYPGPCLCVGVGVCARSKCTSQQTGRR